MANYGLNIDTFKSHVTGIQRATLFEVIVTAPTILGSFSQEEFRFTCKSASVPSSTLGVIEVPYMGRKVKFNGDRSYAEWNTTVIVNNEWSTYKNIYNWHTKMNGPQSNVAATGNMNNLKGTAIIRMYSVTGVSNFSMTLNGFWPMDMQQIDVAWDQNDSTTDLNVTWQYDYAIMN